MRRLSTGAGLGVSPLDIDDAVKAAELLGAELSIPMHYDTFDLIAADPGEFERKIAEKGMKAKIIRVGERLTI